MRADLRLLALALLAALTACSRKAETPTIILESGPVRDDPEAEAGFLGWGTLKGRVTFDGPIPEMLPIDTGDHPHKNDCHHDTLRDETWIIDPASRGVANVVVWLKPPKGKAFPRQPDALKTWPAEVTIDQPHCRFEPHVSVTFPEYFDPDAKTWKPSGQKFVVKNSAGIRHSADIGGTNTLNPFTRYVLEATGSDGDVPRRVVELHADRTALSLRCTYHKWMGAWVWAFDHPYAAVTDAQGRFTIRNAPAGAEVQVAAWHEAGTPEPFSQAKPVVLTIPTGGTLDKNLTLTR